MCKTVTTSLRKIIIKITEQLAGDEIDNAEIVDLKFQFIENDEEAYMLASEIHKLIDILDTL